MACGHAFCAEKFEETGERLCIGKLDKRRLCAGCGEYWPCTVVAGASAYRPAIVAQHTPEGWESR